MAKQFGDNLLPTSAASWVLSNAAFTADGLQINAGGMAYTEVTALNGTNLLPDAFCIQVIAAEYGSKYAPDAYVHLQITYVDNSTYDALVPIINEDNGMLSVLYPTVSNYSIDVSAYASIRYTIYSSVDILLTTYTFQKSLNDTLLEDVNYYGIQISTERGLSVIRSDGQAEALFNADTFSMRSLDAGGNMTDAIYFDTLERKYKVSGNVIIEGSLSSDANFTDSLYAEQGDISQLTVDWLDTSKRVKKYLMQDTSDDDYIDIKEQRIRFMTAKVVMDALSSIAETEQLRNRHGSALYWNKDITDAVIIDGYPYVNGERVYVTEENTGFQVIVYRYETFCKRSIEFEMNAEAGINYPIDTFGAGTNALFPEYGKGKITKRVDGLDFQYTTSTGEVAGIFMQDDGFADVTQRRADIVVDTANLQIKVTPEGDNISDIIIDYTESGNTLTMTWPDGKSFRVVKQ